MRGLRKWVAIALALWAQAAAAETVVFVENIGDGGGGVPDYLLNGFRDMLVTDLVNPKEPPPCPWAVTTADAQALSKAEIDLQQSPAFDPASRVPANHMVQPTITVRGTLGQQGPNTFAWSVDVVRIADGQVLGHDEGSVEGDKLTDATEAIAPRLLKSVCPVPMRVNATYNDLVIDTVVCGFEGPYRLHGTGEAAGIVFDMSPAGGPAQGDFGISGTAAGVPWGGGGTYVLNADPKTGGTLAITGSWFIDSPVGRFGDEGTIPATVTPAEGAACEG